MSSADSNMLKPILIGGVAMGIAASIPGLSCCCCLLALAGGGLSAWLYFKDTAIPEPPPYGPAALLGVGAGAVGGVIVTVLGTLVQMAMGSNMQDMGQIFDQMNLPPEIQQTLEQSMSGNLSPGMLVFSFFINLALYGSFGALGGVLALAFLKKQGGGTPANMGGGSYGTTYQAPQGPPPGSVPGAPPVGAPPGLPPSTPPGSVPPPPQ